jgi:hypothetical protein
MLGEIDRWDASECERDRARRKEPGDLKVVVFSGVNVVERVVPRNVQLVGRLRAIGGGAIRNEASMIRRAPNELLSLPCRQEIGDGQHANCVV